MTRLCLAALLHLIAQSALAHEATVLATDPHLASMARRLTSGTNMPHIESIAVQSAGCAHNYVLRPSDLLKIDRAEIVLDRAPRGQFIEHWRALLNDGKQREVWRFTGSFIGGELVYGDPNEAMEILTQMLMHLLSWDPPNGPRYLANAEQYRLDLKATIAASERLRGAILGRTVVISEPVWVRLLEFAGFRVQLLPSDGQRSIGPRALLALQTQLPPGALIGSDSQHPRALLSELADDKALRKVELTFSDDYLQMLRTNLSGWETAVR